MRKINSILLFTGIVGLILALYFKVFGLPDFNLYNLLTYLSDAPPFIAEFSVSEFLIDGSWGVFDFFRSFLNGFAYVVGFVKWLIGTFKNIIEFLVYFVNYLI